ncbi:MAG: hypothetical protein QQN55_08460 [Nitrosopumilus sp.]
MIKDMPQERSLNFLRELGEYISKKKNNTNENTKIKELNSNPKNDKIKGL